MLATHDELARRSGTPMPTLTLLTLPNLERVFTLTLPAFQLPLCTIPIPPPPSPSHHIYRPLFVVGTAVRAVGEDVEATGQLLLYEIQGSVREKQGGVRVEGVVGGVEGGVAVGYPITAVECVVDKHNARVLVVFS